MAQIIGTGVIILITLWLVSLVSIILFCSAQGKLKLAAVIPCVITAIVTIVLPSIPTSYTSEDDSLPVYNFSYLPLIWILILTLLVVTLVTCFLIYFLTDVLEPRYAHFTKAVKK